MTLQEEAQEILEFLYKKTMQHNSDCVQGYPGTTWYYETSLFIEKLLDKIETLEQTNE
jgi:hypothetical protein